MFKGLGKKADKALIGARAFLSEESGDFGIKEIAITVAIIVIIGVIITVVSGNMSGWIGDLWDMFMERIEEFSA